MIFMQRQVMQRKVGINSAQLNAERNYGRAKIIHRGKVELLGLIGFVKRVENHSGFFPRSLEGDGLELFVQESVILNPKKAMPIQMAFAEFKHSNAATVLRNTNGTPAKSGLKLVAVAGGAL
jgi:hypothetical protein